MKVPLALQIGIQIDDYQTLAKIGAGGMGMVVQAKDCKLNRIVVLKFVLEMHQENDRARQRFYREMQLLAQLHHPNIVKIYNVGHFQGHPYIVMEYISGTTLREYIQQQQLSLEKQLLLLGEIAGALEYAHQNNIIHRDIKPSNIMVRNSGQPVLLDFGLAKITQVANRSLTRTGEIIGTPKYMAPEQARGLKREIDAQTDVYALGGVLYELITGFPPAQGENLTEIVRCILQEYIVPARFFCKDLPKAIEDICMTALARDKKHRYPSAAHFQHALEQYMQGKARVSKNYYLRRINYAFQSYQKAIFIVIALLLTIGLWGIPYVNSIAKQRNDNVYLQNLVHQAQDFYRQRNYPQAIERISQAIGIDAVATHYFLRAQCFFATSSLHAARQDLKMLLADNKLSELKKQAYRLLGAIELQFANYQQAIQYYRRAGQLDNPHRSELLQVARAFFGSKDYERARYYLTTVVNDASLQKNHSEAYAYLGEMALTIGKVQRAKQCLQKALQDKNISRRGYLCLLMGKVYIHQQQYAQAANFLREACKLSPQNIDGHRLLGRVTAKSNQHAAAVAAFTACIKLAPWEAQYYYQRSLSHAAMKQTQLAEQDIFVCLRLQPKNMMAMTLLIDMMFHSAHLAHLDKFKVWMNNMKDLAVSYSLPKLFHEDIEELATRWLPKVDSTTPVDNNKWHQESVQYFLSKLINGKDSNMAYRFLLTVTDNPKLLPMLVKILQGNSSLSASDKRKIEKLQKIATQKKIATDIPKIKRLLIRYCHLRDFSALRTMYQQQKIAQYLQVLLEDNNENAIMRFWAARAASDLHTVATHKLLEQYRSQSGAISLLCKLAAAQKGLSLSPAMLTAVTEEASPYIRFLVAHYLTTSYPKPSRLLWQLLQDSDMRVRLTATMHLPKDNPKVKKIITAAFRHSSESIRAYAHSIYWNSRLFTEKNRRKLLKQTHFAQVKNPYYPLLLAAANPKTERSDIVRYYALLQLARMNPNDSIIDKLLQKNIRHFKMTNQQDSYMRYELIFLLSKRNFALAQSILLDNKELLTARAAVFVARQKALESDLQTVMALGTRLIKDPDWRMRLMTLNGMGFLKHPLIPDLLVQYAKKETDETPALRQAIKFGCILGMINSEPKVLPANFVVCLQQMLRNPQNPAAIRSAAATGLLFFAQLYSLPQRKRLHHEISQLSEEVREGGAAGYAINLYMSIIPPNLGSDLWDWDKMYRRYSIKILSCLRNKQWHNRQNIEPGQRMWLQHGARILQALNRALRLSPKNARYHFERALVYYARAMFHRLRVRHSYQLAICDLEQAVAAKPDYFLYQLWLAQLYFLARLLPEAQRAIDRAVAIDPWDIKARKLQLRIYNSLSLDTTDIESKLRSLSYYSQKN